jgi:hypothetical protein
MLCDISQTYLNVIMHDVLDECRHTSLLYRFAHGYTSHATLRQRIRVGRFNDEMDRRGTFTFMN